MMDRYLLICQGLDRMFDFSAKSHVDNIAHAIARILMYISTTLFNEVCIYTVVRIKTLRRSYSILYILLSLTDFLAGLTRLPVYTYLHSESSHKKEL